MTKVSVCQRAQLTFSLQLLRASALLPAQLWLPDLGTLAPVRYPQLGLPFTALAARPRRPFNTRPGKGAHLASVQGLTNLLQRQQFFALRIALGFISSFCEAKFYRAVVDSINERVGRYVLFGLTFSAGMWGASIGE